MAITTLALQHKVHQVVRLTGQVEAAIKVIVGQEVHLQALVQVLGEVVHHQVAVAEHREVQVAEAAVAEAAVDQDN